MNKKVLKWIIGSLALVVIVPAVVFMLTQDIEKIEYQEEAETNQKPVKMSPDEYQRVGDIIDQFERGLITEEQLEDMGLKVPEDYR
ncbi:hypothetical protein JNUCC42_21325 [Brevibacterium sp. JNUCC-42]|nr:hypothetical protein JNUCC42_21325 [Brevibacterium sp. JNUCC-42]